MVVNDAESNTRVMMHEYYNQNNIDVLFSGASLCYMSFNTTILDEKIECNTFNLGSANQTIDISYYLIKDCINRYDLDHIYLELSPIMAQAYVDADEKEASSMVNTYIISDYMRPSFDKLFLLLAASKPEHYINGFFPARRSWQNLFSPYLGALLQRKSSREYKEYRYDFLRSENQQYAGKGFIENNIQVDERGFCDIYGTYSISTESIDDGWFRYLDKIIEYCRKNDVKLTLLCTPLSDYFLVSHQEEYDDYHGVIEQIAEENELEFWDFSLCKENYFPSDAGQYADAAHLNKYGAEAFSELLADIVKGTVKYEDVVYGTVSEKLENISPDVYGMIYDNNNITIVSNKGEDFEYQIGIITAEDKEILIQEFSQNDSVELTDNYNGTIHIMFRNKNNTDIVQDFFVDIE